MDIRYRFVDGVEDRNAYRPSHNYDLDAGIDLHVWGFHAGDKPYQEWLELQTNALVLVRTGVCVLIPDGYMGLVRERSSYGALGLKVLGGIIDARYTGEIIIPVTNTNVHPITLSPKTRLFQLVVLPIPSFALREVDTFPETERGSRGFGSSGA